MSIHLKSRNCYGVKGYPAEVVAALHADFLALGSLSAVGRKWNRSCSNIRQILQRRGLYAPKASTCATSRRDPATSQFLPGPRLTPEQIDHLVAGMKSFRLPSALRNEWRAWPLTRRAAFIARLREKFRNPRRDLPTTPFSANVEPFDYGTSRAWELMAVANAGLPSRQWIVRLFPNSRGVIWNDQLWFWVPYNDSKGHNGSYQRGKFVPGLGRGQLHWAIWARHHGCAVPPQHVIRFIDGNPNNLAPENLVCVKRDTVCRQNQAAALRRKSRTLTAALLGRHQTNTKGPMNELHELKR